MHLRDRVGKQKIYRCSKSQEPYLSLKEQIHSNLKDIVCGSALKIIRFRKGMSSHKNHINYNDESSRGVDIAQDIELYLRNTANEPLPVQSLRNWYRPFTRFHAQRRAMSSNTSSAGAA